jgi:hypothetical protein
MRNLCSAYVRSSLYITLCFVLLVRAGYYTSASSGST